MVGGTAACLQEREHSSQIRPVFCSHLDLQYLNNSPYKLLATSNLGIHSVRLHRPQHSLPAPGDLGTLASALPIARNSRGASVISGRPLRTPTRSCVRSKSSHL